MAALDIPTQKPQNKVETFLNDDTGICYLIRGALPETGRLFKAIFEQTDWVNERVQMFGEVRTLNRMVGGYADEGVIYRYSGKTLNTTDWKPAALEINKII